MLAFDPSAATARLERMWSLPAMFGSERIAQHVLLNELVSDRYALINGLQVLRDELQFAGTLEGSGDLGRGCGADFALPSVVTTLGYTNCGDRVQSGDSTHLYERLVAQRFATLSELGALKSEAFFPTGGGTDHGATLAHVTATTTVNRTSRDDTIIYLARGTAFAGELRWQGLGLDAARYGGRIVQRHGEPRLQLSYDGHTDNDFPFERSSYRVPRTHKETVVLMEVPKDLS